MSVLFYAFFILAIYGGVSTSIIRLPSQVEVLQSVNVLKFSGIWYDARVTPAEIHVDSCVFTNITVDKDNTVSVFAVQILKNEKSEYLETKQQFSESQLDDLPLSDYRKLFSPILATDYVSYAVIFMVTGFFGDASALIMTRVPDPPDSVIDEAFQIVEEKTWFKRTAFSEYHQTYCG